MRKKMTNSKRVLKLLESGPRTQAEIARLTGVKNVYQIVAEYVGKGLLTKENGLVKLNGLPVAVDETKAVSKTKVVPNERVDLIATFKAEIDDIADQIHALNIARSYLLQRCREESRNV
jgi:hypothetical protein